MDNLLSFGVAADDDLPKRIDGPTNDAGTDLLPMNCREIAD